MRNRETQEHRESDSIIINNHHARGNQQIIHKEIQCFQTEERVEDNLKAIENHEVMAAFDVRQAFDDLYNPNGEAGEDV